MELLAWFWDLVVHLDAHLAAFVAQHGVWIYALLFAIVFCETGLVVTPFLPGDSLLFVAGAVAATGDMNIALLMTTLVAAALCGDNVNYWVGRWIGPKVFHFEKSRWFNPAHLQRAHAFYEKHGGKTIILARFIPIVRTYVPFVAGVGAMPYVRYLTFCVIGALIWVVSLCLLGYWFGNQPIVKNNLTIVILLIVALSISPGVVAWLRSRYPRLPVPVIVAAGFVAVTAGIFGMAYLKKELPTELQVCEQRCTQTQRSARLVPVYPGAQTGGKVGLTQCECY